MAWFADTDDEEWFDSRADDWEPIIMAPAQFTMIVHCNDNIKTFPNLSIHRDAMVSNSSVDRDW